MSDAPNGKRKRRHYRKRSSRSNQFGPGNKLAKEAYPAAVRALQAIRGPTGKFILNPETVHDLAQWGLPHGEIAAMMGIALSTFKNIIEREAEISDAFEKGRAMMKFRLRHAQMTTALEGNPTMQIFMGKVELGQKEARHVTHDHNVSGTIDVGVDVREQARDKLRAFTKNREGPTQEDLDTMPKLPGNAAGSVIDVEPVKQLEEAASG